MKSNYCRFFARYPELEAEYYRTGRKKEAICSFRDLYSASGISDQFSTLNSRQASTSDSRGVAVQSPRHQSTQRREVSLPESNCREQAQALDDLTVVLEPRSLNFLLSRNFDPSTEFSCRQPSLPAHLSFSFYLSPPSLCLSLRCHLTNDTSDAATVPFELSFRRIESPPNRFGPETLRAKHQKFLDLVHPTFGLSMAPNQGPRRWRMPRNRISDHEDHFPNKQPSAIYACS